MKYILLIPAFFSLAFSQAQSTIREFGIGFTNFDQFSLQYRWGDGTRFYRLNGNINGAFVTNDKTTTSGSGNTGSIIVTQTSPIDLGVGAGFSVLKLKPMNEKIGLMYGINYSFSYAYYESKISYQPPLNGQTGNNSTSSLRPSVGMVLGGYFKIIDDFFLYAEVIPNLYYQSSKSIRDNYDPNSGDSHLENSTNSFGISGLSNSGASLTLVYRFATAAK